MFGLETQRGASRDCVEGVKGLSTRTMVDGMLCTNECRDARIREGKPRVLYKLALEKANDHVN